MIYGYSIRRRRGAAEEDAGMTKRTAKQIMRTAEYKAAAQAVTEYAARYIKARGRYPSISVAMMPAMEGWPVRNPAGGSAIAYFATAEVANAAVAAAWRDHRDYVATLNDSI
jgi:hypothetical protein